MKKVDPKKQIQGQSQTLVARSSAKFLRISPRKVRLVINTIRYQPTDKAFNILMTLKNKGARLAEKVLKTAVANAKVLGLDENRLYVSEVRADGGTSMKRFMSRSMGRADRILKRTTHLSMVLAEGGKVREKKEDAPAAKKKNKQELVKS